MDDFCLLICWYEVWLMTALELLCDFQWNRLNIYLLYNLTDRQYHLLYQSAVQQMQSKFKQLHNKLNSISNLNEQTGEHSNKAKIRNIQQLVNKLQQRFEEESTLYDHKINSLFQTLRKVENTLKDNSNQLEIEENNWNGRVGKMDKVIRKMMQKIGKERKQADKKIQNTLQNYLIQLTSFKGKATSSCAASIRELKELEKDVEHLQREVKREAQLSADIYKKIYSQFSTQIQQIGCNLGQEQRERQQSQEEILDSIERVYNLLSGSIVQGRRSRQRQQKDIVELLQRVIQKLKYEIIND